jgi:shikimate kinase
MKIFLIGFMGCGKTTWGRKLSDKLHLPFFDLDQKIVEHEGKSIPDIFTTEGEEYFRLLEKDVLHLLVENHESFVMATGGGTPCFYNNIDYLKKKGVTVWLNCSIDCLHKRLAEGKAERPLLKSVSDNDLKSYIIRKYSNRKIFYQQANVSLNEEELTIDKLVEAVFHS